MQKVNPNIYSCLGKESFGIEQAVMRIRQFAPSHDLRSEKIYLQFNVV